MNKCSLCGKKITNINTVDNKNYGSGCFKLVLAMKKAMLQQEQNLEYNRKCVALLSVLKDKIFKDVWNNNFKNQILDQWENYGKLSFKQFKLILEKFTTDENISYQYNFISQLEDEKEIKKAHDDIYYKNCNYYVDLNIIKKRKELETTLLYKFKRHGGYFWSHDIDDTVEKEFIRSIDDLENAKNDEFTVITKIVVL